MSNCPERKINCKSCVCEFEPYFLSSEGHSLGPCFVWQVSFGWGHALAQTEDGKLFGWGYSADGRLGSTAGTLETSPLESSMLENGELSSSTLEAAEKLVLEGMEKEKNMPVIWEPRLVSELHGIQVLDIACGLDHSLILCGRYFVLSSFRCL